MGQASREEYTMDKLHPDLWVDICTRKITELDDEIDEREARQLARAMKSFERTGVMPPEAAVEFVSQEMARGHGVRFERRQTPRS
jgi:hypothetical protein